MRKFITATLLAGCLLTGRLAPAATLEVTHSPTTSQFATVSDALGAATTGDVVEIIDNSAPFVEAILFQGTTGVTIQGRDGLTPRPTIKGVANTYHIASEQGTYPNGATITGVGASGNVLRNLIIDGSANNLVCDSRFGLASLENVDVLLGAGMTPKKGFLNSANDLSLTNVKISGEGNGIEHWFTGTLTLNKVRVETGRAGSNFDEGIALDMHHGNVNATDCYFSTSVITHTVRFTFADEIANNAAVDTFTNCLFTSTYGGPDLTLLVTCKQHTNFTQPRNLTFDNCDFIGNTKVDPNPIVAAVGSEVQLTQLHVVDSIIYGIPQSWFANYVPLDAAKTIEDYNIFQKTVYDAATNKFTPGSHSKILADTDLLFVDPAKGDFQVFPTSLAATLNSTGTPAWAGSQGVSTVPVELSSFTAE